MENKAQIVIEKGVPLPPPKLRGGYKYPFREMEVGDSCLVPDCHYQKAFSAAYITGKRHGMKFRAATEGTGVRVWRTE